MSLVFAGVALAVGLMSSAEIGPSDRSASGLENGQGTPRMLYICGRDDVSKRTFKRQHGEVTFVTAKAVMASRTDGSRWTTPRCITGAEFLRLERMTDDLAFKKQALR